MEEDGERPAVGVPELKGYARSCKFAYKIQFSQEEDAKLLSLVRIFGANQWKVVSAAMVTRNSRQCRERYNNYLNPALRSDSWTQDEDEQLCQLIEKHGPRWSCIARNFGDRSVSAVRDRHVELVRNRFLSKCVAEDKKNVHATSNESGDVFERTLTRVLQSTFNEMTNDVLSDCVGASTGGNRSIRTVK